MNKPPEHFVNPHEPYTVKSQTPVELEVTFVTFLWEQQDSVAFLLRLPTEEEITALVPKARGLMARVEETTTLRKVYNAAKPGDRFKVRGVVEEREPDGCAQDAATKTFFVAEMVPVGATSL